MTRSDEILKERLERKANILIDGAFAYYPEVVRGEISTRLKYPVYFTAMRLLEMLTPGGSEFAGDPFECYSYVKKKIESLQDLAKERVKHERHI